MRHSVKTAITAAGISLVLAACGSSGQTTSVARSAPTDPPTGSPGGAPPGGSTSSYSATGAYTRSGGSATLTGKLIIAGGSDASGVLVDNGGRLALVRTRVQTTGSSKSSDASSFYGLDAGVLAQRAGAIQIIGGSVSTHGDGANGVFAYGSGPRVTIARTTITAAGQYAHGAMASGGGSLKLTGVKISTAGASSAAIATDRGGGTIEVIGGTMNTSGFRSPGIYSTGEITVRGASMTATGAEAAVVEGANSITVTNTKLTAAKQHGVMLYNSMSGDASAGTGSYTMHGGSLNAAAGPAFYVTNTRAVIMLADEATVSARSGVLLRADSAGTGSGNTGAGIATLRLRGERVRGNLTTAGSGTIAAALQRHTTLTATINTAAVSIDSTSIWNVTGDSALTTLSDALTPSAGRIGNIVGNGHTVTYDASLAANSWLHGKTYKLTGGGVLKPA